MNYPRDGSNIWLAIIAIAIGLFAGQREAGAHDALPTAAQPLGWKYDLSCCSGRDCRQLSDKEVRITPQGYEWDGEIFPMNSHKIRQSPDGYYHGCKMDSGNRPCLYTPGFGS